MATTNVNNLDGLDAVANIAAGGEVIIKDCVNKIIAKTAQGDPRILGLFIGQMAAEGFVLTKPGLLYTVESPTVKIEVYEEAAGQKMIKAYVLVSAAWVLVAQRQQSVLSGA